MELKVEWALIKFLTFSFITLILTEDFRELKLLSLISLPQTRPDLSFSLSHHGQALDHNQLESSQTWIEAGLTLETLLVKAWVSACQELELSWQTLVDQLVPWMRNSAQDGLKLQLSSLLLETSTTLPIRTGRDSGLQPHHQSHTTFRTSTGNTLTQVQSTRD